jgi:hypothetical protein
MLIRQRERATSRTFFYAFVNPIASLGLKREKGYTSPLKTIHYPTQNQAASSEPEG